MGNDIVTHLEDRKKSLEGRMVGFQTGLQSLNATGTKLRAKFEKEMGELQEAAQKNARDQFELTGQIKEINESLEFVKKGDKADAKDKTEGKANTKKRTKGPKAKV